MQVKSLYSRKLSWLTKLPSTVSTFFPLNFSSSQTQLAYIQSHKGNITNKTEYAILVNHCTHDHDHRCLYCLFHYCWFQSWNMLLTANQRRYQMFEILIEIKGNGTCKKNFLISARASWLWKTGGKGTTSTQVGVALSICFNHLECEVWNNPLKQRSIEHIRF